MRPIVAVVALAAIPVSIFAADLTLGERVEAELPSSESVSYEMEVTEGQSLRLEGHSDDFRMVVEYTDPSGTAKRDFFRNEPLQPQIIFTAEQTGTAQVLVRSARVNGSGDFSLGVVEHSPVQLTPMEETVLTFGDDPVHAVLNAEASNLILQVKGERRSVQLARIAVTGGSLRLGELRVMPRTTELIIDGIGEGVTDFTFYPLQEQASNEVTVKVIPLTPQSEIVFAGGEGATAAAYGLVLGEDEPMNIVGIRVESPSRCRVEVSSDDFSPFVLLLSEESLRMGDGDRTAYLRATALEPTEMVVVVRAQGGDVSGEFSVSVTGLGEPGIPAFTLEDTEGNSMSKSDLEGKIVVLDYWASWCAPCLMAMPHLMEVAEEYADRGVVVVGISDDEPEDLRALIEEREVNFITLLDDGQMQVAINELLVAMGSSFSYPSTVILDREGKVADAFTGVLRVGPDRRIEEALDALLEEDE